MTATDTIRAMLDERHVKWDELVGHPVVVGTEWHDRNGYPCTALEHADDVPDGMLSVQANLTPEQAIEATLGRGECHDVGRYCFTCSECGWVANEPHHMLGGFRPNYCPSCGRKVRA